MPELGQTFDLSRILMTAQSLQAMKRQASTDKLQEEYMRNREGREVAQETRAVTEFDQTQQLTNTKMLNAAAAEVMQNPNAAQRWLPQLKQAGIVNGDVDISQVPPEQLQTMAKELFDSTSAALSALNPAPAPQATDDQREYAAAQQQGYKGSLQEWITGNKEAGRPVTNVNVDTGKKFGETLAAEQAKQYSGLYEQAQKAPQILERSSRVSDLLKTGAYTGTAADWKLTFGKAARAAGFDYAGSDLANTEALFQELGGTTLSMIRESGLGAGNGFTNTDREFLEKVVGGKITLERGTLARVAVLNQRAAKATMKRWNDTAGRLSKANPGLLEQLGMTTIDAPPEGSENVNGPLRVATPEEARSLPPNTEFIDANGVLRKTPP